MLVLVNTVNTINTINTMSEVRDKTVELFLKLLNDSIDMESDQASEWANSIEAGIYDAAENSAEAVGLNKDLEAKVVTKIASKTRRKASGPCNIMVETKPFLKVYRDVMWKVFSALKLNSGAETLLDNLCEETILPYSLGGMTHFQLDPNCFAAKREREKVLEAEKSGRRWKPGTGRRGISIRIPYDIIEEYDEASGKYIEHVVEVPDSMLTCGKCGMSKTTSYEMQTRSADEPMTIFAKCLCCENRWRF